MKTIKQLSKTCCLFISAAALVFIAANANAQSNERKNPEPDYTTTLYVPVGSDLTITGINQNGTGCNSSYLGTKTTCFGTGWVNGTCSSLPRSCCSSMTYSWAPSTYLTCTTCANPICTPPCNGGSVNITYTLTVSGCGYQPNCATVNVQVGPCCLCCRIGHFASQEEQESPDVKVFPNPSNGQVTVQFVEITANTSIQVYNLAGEMVMEKKNITSAGKTVPLDLSGYPKGAYFIQVFDGDVGKVNKRIIIE